MTALEHIVLVNEKDEMTGTMEKLEVHEKGLLHRAFSIFIINRNGEWLLHKRAAEKYHSAGLWTNACCSHPFPGEEVLNGAHRRLQQELGFDCKLKKAFHFTYKAHFENGLTEFEFDHVFLGVYDGEIAFNPAEISEYKYIGTDELAAWIEKAPNEFTRWFCIAFPQVLDYTKNLNVNL